MKKLNYEQTVEYLAGKNVNLIKDGGNAKLGKTMGTFSKTAGNELTSFRRSAGKDKDTIFEMKGSCGGNCDCCHINEKITEDIKNAIRNGEPIDQKQLRHFYWCYVMKSYRYDSVCYGHAINTAKIRKDIGKAFDDMDKQLTRKKKKYEVVRINQAGELESERELLMWIELASKHPETVFYIYTKAFTFVEYVLEKLGKLPANFFLNISMAHEYGIDIYNKYKHVDGVKAFIYMDKNVDTEHGWGPEEYTAHGVEVQTMCMAYGTDGKMNHNITCEKCRKCFNKTCKVIGCWSH